MADYQVPPYEFTAAQELRMRRDSAASRADPTQLAKVAPEFAPASAGQARDAAAQRLRGRSRGTEE